MADGIGLSVGATALRAVAVGRSAVTRSPVLTRFPHRPAEVGLPSENPNLTERGLIITDFVDRVGDPVAIVASDGSSHRAEVLLADALRSLLQALTGGRPPTEPVGITHPAHWRPAAVEALRGALDQPALLTSDAAAALTALQDEPGLPTRGIVALCDVGGTGASVTLVDAANGLQPIGPTVRHPDFSGDLVDAALLNRVVADLASSGSVDLTGTSAIGNLGRLRGQCRAAKERLSTASGTSLAVDLPGRRTDVRVTRTELDEAIRQPIDGFLDVVQDTLARNGIRAGELAAVAAVGGGARIPILVTSLSERLRVPVITSAQPELAAAIGGALKAVRAQTPDGATSMAPAAVAPVVPAPTVDTGAPASSTFRALAWSDASDIPEPAAPEAGYDESEYEPHDPRPQIAFADHEDEAALAASVPWYRRPAAVLAAAAIALLLAIGTVAFYLLRDDESPTPAPSSTPATATTAPPASGVAPPASDAPPADTPAPEQTVYQQAPPPPAVTVTQEPPPASETPPPPPATTEAPAPPPSTTTTIAPSTVTVTEPPPSSTTPQPVIPTLPYQTIPGLPFVPAPIQPAQP
ncbi:Hsp70 family protein [Mycolicibacterium sp.]|uniref:Hsp70 family protein n=1 Tax=Mycolicibacterium sp. TaxID=2320850 RepID=UPI001A1C2830|nr:Hsp70 family protein [Mycolicibacterium sp.]MBJ7340673.1 Hsp70 family protein [Mycolicibacterium sp.]